MSKLTDFRMWTYGFACICQLNNSLCGEEALQIVNDLIFMYQKNYTL